MSSENENTPLLFDHYSVERRLGTGAMGVVYLARDLRIGRHVALKTLRTGREASFDDSGIQIESFNRFKREAQVCASLLHPNIVTLYEIGAQADRLVWMAMEYVEGESLASILQRRGRLPLDMAVGIMVDVLRGLAYAHDRGVVHRDVKPANILIAADGTAKIADFGIARASDANLTDITDRGRLLGTPHYMSPEQVAGRRVDGRSDLFSAGIVFYEMISGRKPFDSASLTDVLYSVVNRPVPPVREVDPELPRWCARWIDRMLEKKPENRWGDAHVAARELRHMAGLSGEYGRAAAGLSTPMPAGTDQTPTTPITSPPMRQRRFDRSVPTAPALAVIAALLILLGGGIAFGVRELVREPPPTDGVAERELDERRRLLREAELLYDAGAYPQAVERYETYLARWPGTPAALEGKAKAEAAMTGVVQQR